MSLTRRKALGLGVAGTGTIGLAAAGASWLVSTGYRVHSVENSRHVVAVSAGIAGPTAEHVRLDVELEDDAASEVAVRAPDDGPLGTAAEVKRGGARPYARAEEGRHTLVLTDGPDLVDEVGFELEAEP